MQPKLRGYLVPYLPELTIRDYNTYLRYRRGIRHQMYKDFGIPAALLFKGDTAVIALLSDSLAGREATLKEVWVSPLRKLPILCHTRGILLAGQISIIMAWHALKDQPKESMNLRMRLRSVCYDLFLKKAFEKACEQNPALERLICQQREQSLAQSMTRGRSYDVASEPMANVYAALYAVAAQDDPMVRNAMRHVGYSIGRSMYFLRKVFKYEKEQKSGHYNVFVENGLSRADAMENARRHCAECADNLARTCNKLDIKLNRALLENILVLNLQHLVDTVGLEQKEEKWEIP